LPENGAYFVDALLDGGDNDDAREGPGNDGERAIWACDVFGKMP
jgi:hypothetical protein